MRLQVPTQRLLRPRSYRKPERPFLIDMNHPLSRGLISFWPGGNNAAGFEPEIVQGNHGLIQGGPLSPPFGTGYHGGRSSNLNGSSQYLSVAGRAYTLPKFTVLGFCFSSGSLAGQTIMAAANSDVSLCSFYLQGQRIGFTNAASSYQEATWTAPTSNIWHQFFGTYDGTTLSGGYDGIIRNSAARSGPPSTTTAAQFSIGKFGALNGGYFGGGIEALRIYDRALSPTELMQLWMEPYAGVYSANDFLVGGGSANTETGTAVLGLSGISFAGLGGRKETGTANLAFRGISFNGTGLTTHIKGTGNMAFGGVTITASGFDPGAPGQGLRQFWTC
jgi:hypothetical protein